MHYDKGTKEQRDRITAVMKEHHGDRLAKHGVTVGLLIAHGDPESEQPRPLRKNKIPVDGLIRIVPERDRVAGLKDVQMVLDGDVVDELTDEELDALIDHELTSVVVKLDADGIVRTDDAGRPKLGIRAHDWQVTGFAEVVRRHQAASPEFRQVDALRTEYEQLRLFGDEPDQLEAK